MTCDEFQALGPDFARDAERAADAHEHLQRCPRCAALHESWHELRDGLRALARETQSAETPPRVELVLRAAVRARQPRGRLVPLWAWGLAAAAAVAFLVAWAPWRVPRLVEKPAGSAPPITTQRPAVAPAPQQQSSPSGAAARAAGLAPPSSQKQVSPVRASAPSRPSQVASAPQDLQTATNEFVALPYGLPLTSADDAAVVRVRMQRAALGVLGLPVNEERADEWVMVDLLIGADGQPQAVRLSR